MRIKDQQSFDIPDSWEWERLGCIANINMGQSPAGTTMNDTTGMEFHQGKVCFGDKYLKQSNKYTTDAKKIADVGDVLISVRAPVGTIKITKRYNFRILLPYPFLHYLNKSE